MCDYSLEVYGSKPAREGERYVTSRFQSGTIGLADPATPGTAVCLNCDTSLTLDSIPGKLQKAYDLHAEEDAVFIRLDKGTYRDGFQFQNGVKLCLQEFSEGCGVTVKSLLENQMKTPMFAREMETAEA